MLWFIIVGIIVIASAVLVTIALRGRTLPKTDPPLGLDKHALDLMKLRLEVRELNAGAERARAATNTTIVTAALTATITLAIGVSGAILQQYAQRQQNAQDYSKLVENFGSTTASARAGAVIGLSPYASPHSEKLAQTVAVLTNGLSTESDYGVLQLLTTNISTFGDAALPSTVALNRRASVLLFLTAHDYGRSVAQRLCPAANSPRGLSSADRGHGGGLSADGVIARIISERLMDAIKPLLRDGPAGEPELIDAENYFRADALYNATWCLEANANRAVFKETADRDPHAMEQQARALLVTGRLLGPLIRGSRTSPSGSSLRRIALFQVDWKPTRADPQPLALARADLQGAFITGNADQTVLDESDLSGADLSALSLNGASVRNAKLRGAKLLINGNGIPDFTGANWPDAMINGHFAAQNSSFAWAGSCDPLAATLREKYPYGAYSALHPCIPMNEVFCFEQLIRTGAAFPPGGFSAPVQQHPTPKRRGLQSAESSVTPCGYLKGQEQKSQPPAPHRPAQSGKAP